MYKIDVTPSAKSDLRKIKKVILQRAISEAIGDLKYNPFVGKPLKRELTGRNSYKVGNYRIIYKVMKRDKIVKILKVQHRSVVYN